MLKLPNLQIPKSLSKFFAKKDTPREYFFSLFLGPTEVEGGAWEIQTNQRPELVISDSIPVATDDWEERIRAVDTLIGVIEETTGEETLKKVVLGLPQVYLTDSGDILKTITGEVRKFKEMLGLDMIGFVALHQALSHKMKKEEGVPATVIFLGCFGATLSVHIYKIGQLAGQISLPLGEDIVVSLEQALKSFTDLEVLPSRLILYGDRRKILLEHQAKLLKHPWQNRVNFMHFPKIDVVEDSHIAMAISLAGASELASSVTEEVKPETDTPPTVVDEHTDAPFTESEQRETAIPVPLNEVGEDIVSEEGELEEMNVEDANVVVVQPEILGFHKSPVKTEVSVSSKAPPETVDEVLDVQVEAESAQGEEIFQKPGIWEHLGKLWLSLRPEAGEVFGGKKMWLVSALVGIVLLVIFVSVWWMSYKWLPQSTVTIFILPQSYQKAVDISIDPSVVSIDREKQIIPGFKQEKVINGEKTISVTGKKNVGDQARGTVNIFNKSLTSKTLRKGALISSGSLQFTLDADVTIASASENLVSGTVTFGKGAAAVTAAAIGPQSNLPASTEFTVKDVANSVLVARNEQNFAGGTSRQVTVVSRADYDNLVKIITDESLKRAKNELAASSQDGSKLIESTVKSTVSDKIFNHEIGEEADSLLGQISISVSGVFYKEQDIRDLLLTTVETEVPSGFKIDPELTQIEIASVQSKKDGSLKISATIETKAVPVIDELALQKSLAGKILSESEDYLKSLTGVAALEFRFYNSPFRDHLPERENNIKIELKMFE